MHGKESGCWGFQTPQTSNQIILPHHTGKAKCRFTGTSPLQLFEWGTVYVETCTISGQLCHYSLRFCSRQLEPQNPSGLSPHFPPKFIHSSFIFVPASSLSLVFLSSCVLNSPCFLRQQLYPPLSFHFAVLIKSACTIFCFQAMFSNHQSCLGIHFCLVLSFPMSNTCCSSSSFKHVFYNSMNISSLLQWNFVWYTQGSITSFTTSDIDGS